MFMGRYLASSSTSSRFNATLTAQSHRGRFVILFPHSTKRSKAWDLRHPTRTDPSLFEPMLPQLCQARYLSGHTPLRLLAHLGRPRCARKEWAKTGSARERGHLEMALFSVRIYSRPLALRYLSGRQKSSAAGTGSRN